ncbi:MAG: arginine--tRNA ligase [Propionibacteriaceae bacterium]|jgi:arginyl-tRNA synthetase|nr:arginine--tRNA ligase [Propionibacteriaceae bacterium]
MPSLYSQLYDRLAAAAGADPELKPASRPAFGHYQANAALRLAHERGQNPRQVAAEIVAAADVTGLCEPLEIAGPGFINIRLTRSALAQMMAAQMTDPAAGIEPVATPQQVVVDYSAPNVAKPMHVGNLRSTIIGDCLVRVLRAQGHSVKPQNHIGDWGTQFGMLVEQIIDDQVDVASLDLNASVALYRQAQAHFKADPAFADASRRRVVALQSGDPQTRAIWQALIEVSKISFNRAYRRLGVLLTDDDLAGESIYNDLLPAVAADLTAAGIAVRDQGALVVFDPDQPDDAPLIVQKSDGGFGYAATDLAAIRYRVDQLHANRLIYVVGIPQTHHFQQVFATARRAGWLPEGVTAEHVGFGSVLGPDGKMFKTRQGQAVSLDSLLDDAEQVAAPDVAVAAVKYADLSNSLHKDYVFDSERMTATTGNTGPYLQYAHARANQILRKAEAWGVGVDPSAALTLLFGATTTDGGPDTALADGVLTEPAEDALLLALSRFPDIVAEVGHSLQPHRLCVYLFDLATAMSAFYEQCPVLKAEGLTRTSRLLLCAAVKQVLAQGLDLLGIVAPDRM